MRKESSAPGRAFRWRMLLCGKGIRSARLINCALSPEWCPQHRTGDSPVLLNCAHFFVFFSSLLVYVTCTCSLVKPLRNLAATASGMSVTLRHTLHAECVELLAKKE